jgi:hypothetical protein
MNAVMVEIQPIRVEIDREDDGRILASVPDLLGFIERPALAYDDAHRAEISGGWRSDC